jgi:CubicO group peptidase (beta-lactamase class C family)
LVTRRQGGGAAPGCRFRFRGPGIRTLASFAVALAALAWGDPGPGQPALDGESVFEIGSITKVFTGSVLADMVLKGEVSLDEPVQQFLPLGATVPIRNGRELTLGMLAEQNSGLPRMPDNFAPASRSPPGCASTWHPGTVRGAESCRL